MTRLGWEWKRRPSENLNWTRKHTFSLEYFFCLEDLFFRSLIFNSWRFWLVEPSLSSLYPEVLRCGWRHCTSMAGGIHSGPGNLQVSKVFSFHLTVFFVLVVIVVLVPFIEWQQLNLFVNISSLLKSVYINKHWAKEANLNWCFYWEHSN